MREVVIQLRQLERSRTNRSGYRSTTLLSKTIDFCQQNFICFLSFFTEQIMIPLVDTPAMWMLQVAWTKSHFVYRIDVEGQEKWQIRSFMWKETLCATLFAHIIPYHIHKLCCALPRKNEKESIHINVDYVRSEFSIWLGPDSLTLDSSRTWRALSDTGVAFQIPSNYVWENRKILSKNRLKVRIFH